MHHQFDLRHQLVDRLAQRLAEDITPLPIHSPVKCFAYIDAVEPEFDVILFVGHEVLEKRKSEVHRLRS
jgi:hypothetical protein